MLLHDDNTLHSSSLKKMGVQKFIKEHKIWLLEYDSESREKQPGTAKWLMKEMHGSQCVNNVLNNN